MIKVTNTLNRPRVFTLKDNKSLRFRAYGTRELPRKTLTKEMENNVNQGLLTLVELSKAVEKKTTKVKKGEE